MQNTEEKTSIDSLITRARSTQIARNGAARTGPITWWPHQVTQKYAIRTGQLGKNNWGKTNKASTIWSTI